MIKIFLYNNWKLITDTHIHKRKYIRPNKDSKNKLYDVNLLKSLDMI